MSLGRMMTDVRRPADSTISYFRYGANLRTRLTSAGVSTLIISSYRRFTRFDFLRRRWLLPLLVRISLPLPLYLNLLAVALCVLIFGNFPSPEFTVVRWFKQTRGRPRPPFSCQCLLPLLHHLCHNSGAIAVQAAQALLAARAQDHQHSATLQAGLLLDIAYIL